MKRKKRVSISSQVKLMEFICDGYRVYRSDKDWIVAQAILETLKGLKKK